MARQPEQRGESGVVIHREGKQGKEKMLHSFIVDPETGKNVGVIRHGEVFRYDKEETRIATILNSNLYDLGGNLVGRFDHRDMIGVTCSIPIAFRNLLEGANPRARIRSGSSNL